MLLLLCPTIGLGSSCEKARRLVPALLLYQLFGLEAALLLSCSEPPYLVLLMQARTSGLIFPYPVL